MGKSKISVFNAISALVLSLVNGVLGLVVTRLVLSRFGSEFNGLNSVATQIINMMLIIEGGITLATNVALLKPYRNREFKAISSIIIATGNIFKKIGVIFLILGVVVTIIYSYIVRTSLDNIIVVLVLLMTFVPAAINLYFTMKYRILIQAEQKEYIISSIAILTITLGHLINMFLIYCDFNVMWGVRLVVMICSILNSVIIIVYCKRKYSFLDKSVKPDYLSIRGTKDVFIQKITGAFYSTLPIIFISIFSASGTASASVYAVYNSVFLLVKSMLYAITNAPRLSMGQTISEDKSQKTYSIYLQYELISLLILILFLISTSTLITPFVNIYTKGINDINYTDYYISLLLIIITFLEILHIPSGHIINMSGNFKISKIFQIIACGILLTVTIVGSIIFGIYGVLFGVLLTALFLAIAEIYYTHCVFFKKGLKTYWKILYPNIIVGIILISLELNFTLNIDHYFAFMIKGLLLIIINFFLLILTNFLFNKKLMKPILTRMKDIVL